MKNKKLGYIIFASLIALVSSIGLVKYAKVAGAQAPIPVLSGYAYSSNFGSISFNCKNLGVCGSSSYKVIVNSQGYLTGFAWANPQDSVSGANNIGWLQFGNLSGFPSTGGTGTNARVIGTPGNQTIVGWARFCTPAYPSLSCVPPSANAGGWDGWVSFDGPGRNISISGTSVPAGSGVFPLSGFAWGADFIDSNGNGVADSNSNELVGPGWIDMSGVKYEADETQPQVPALYLSATLASATNTTDLTYSTDPGVNFTSCAGGMAVDNVTGTSQSAPGWTGTLLTLAGTKISRTVTGVDVPFAETHFRVDCYDSNGGLHADAIVLANPDDDDEDVPQIDLCMMDFTTPNPAMASNCGTGNPVSMYYPFNSSQARLIWKATPGASLSNCSGLLGATGWTNQTLATPLASYNGPQNKALGGGITTVYQMECTDNLTGLTVTSNTATAIVAPEDTHPTLRLRGNKTGISDPYLDARTPATAIPLPQGGGDIYLKWETTDILSQCTVSSNWPLPNTRIPNGVEGPIHVTSATTFRIDCPTGTSSSNVGRPLTDYVYVSVDGIVVNPPSGPKKPIFIEY